jgi:hypothetical protein
LGDTLLSINEPWFLGRWILWLALDPVRVCPFTDFCTSDSQYQDMCIRSKLGIRKTAVARLADGVAAEYGPA